MRQILVYPNEILRKKALLVTDLDGQTTKDLTELEEILRDQKNGAGLAAPQIGINKRFFGLKVGDKKKVDILVNPEILGVYGKKDWIKLKAQEKSGEDRMKDEDFLEGCLSFPDLFGTVKRWLKIRARWQDKNLVVMEKDLVGFEAIVFQHELDHLDGILFIDHIKRDGGKLYRQIGVKMIEEDLGKFF